MTPAQHARNTVDRDLANAAEVIAQQAEAALTRPGLGGDDHAFVVELARHARNRAALLRQRAQGEVEASRHRQGAQT